MVIFMIALSSALLISLTDSTYVAMRLNSAAEQRIKAEYILKSAVNVAQVLIKNDITSFDDPTQDAWMMFADGREIPGELLSLPEPNIRVSLLISSSAGKIPIANVFSAGNPTDTSWRDILTRLFKVLGFDNPAPNAARGYGNSAPQMNSEEMVANLIDYLDSDKQNYQSNNFAPGIEGNLPEGQEFRNEQTIDSLANELATIPGFTPGRIQRILPFVSKQRFSKVNMNAAPIEVIASMHPDIDEPTAQKIFQCRQPSQGGPFNDIRTQLVGCGIDPNIAGDLKFAVQGSLYDVIAKVEYGTSMFMASAELSGGGNGRLPKLLSFQAY
jgi:type II secretory pathway component PulK